MTFARSVILRSAAVAVPFAALVACGSDDGDEGSGANSGTLRSGDIEFAVDFRGAEKTDGEVRRGGQVAEPPAGTEWWAFELVVRNPSKNYGANTPDLGVSCGAEDAASVQVVDQPGFIMGEPPYATGMLDAGASNTAVIPLAVPIDGEDCRLVVKMDALHGETEPLEFAFE